MSRLPDGHKALEGAPQLPGPHMFAGNLGVSCV